MDLFEIVVILALALIVLGPERLPEVLKVAGKILRELRLASNTVLRELNDAMEEVPDVRTPIKALPEPKPAAAGEPAPKTEPPSKPPEPPSEST